MLPFHQFPPIPSPHVSLPARTNSDLVWRTISDFQKDPYTTGLSIFSKITDKILFR